MQDHKKYVLIEEHDRSFSQGDVFFVRVDELPEDAKPAPDQVIAHSETGHHHVAKQARVFMHATDTERGYLVFDQAPGAGLLDMPRIEHERQENPHRTYALIGAGVIEYRRQRQFTPEGYETRNLD